VNSLGRREFLRGLIRHTAAGGVVAGCALLVLQRSSGGGSSDCVKTIECGGCDLFGDCDLPRALATRQTARADKLPVAPNAAKTAVPSPNGAMVNSQGRQPLVNIGQDNEPQRGDGTAALSGLIFCRLASHQGLAPLAINCRRVAAQANGPQCGPYGEGGHG
jgi:hypothetical protein